MRINACTLGKYGLATKWLYNSNAVLRWESNISVEVVPNAMTNKIEATFTEFRLA